MRLCSSVTRGPCQDFLANYPILIQKKVIAIAEALTLEQNAEASPAELVEAGQIVKKQIFMEIKKIFSENLSNTSKVGLTYHAAHLIINFTIRLFNSTKSDSYGPLNQNLCLVADRSFNFNKSAHFSQDCDKLFAFFISENQFDLQDFSQKLKDSESEKAKFYLLGCAYATDSSMLETQKFLVQSCEKIAFNDKNKDALNSIQYFRPFFKAIDSKTYFSEVHHQIQFAMNRNSSLLPNVSELVSCFKELTVEQACQLSKEIVQSEYLTNDSVPKLFTNVCERVKQLKEFASIVVSHLLAEYDKINLNPNTTVQDKIKVIRLAAVCSLKLESSQDGVFSRLIELISNSQDDVDFLTYQEIRQVLNQKNFEVKNFTQSQVQVMRKLGLSYSGEKVFQKLITQKFDTAINASVLLTFISYCCQCGMTNKVLEHEAVSKYLLSDQSPINQSSYFKRPLSESDVVNHMWIIECCLLKDLKSVQKQTVHQTFVEYLLNPDIKFRSQPVFGCLRAISKQWNSEEVFQFAQLLFQKLQSIQISENLQSMQVPVKIRQVLSIIVPKDTQLDQETFTTVLQLIAHPEVSSTPQMLKQIYQTLKKQISKWQELFQSNKDQIIQKFFRDRTGVMSPNKTVQKVAVNVLTMLGWAGELETILIEISPVLDYKPIEMLEKLENLYLQEFDRISHYDLMAQSELTQNMLNHFSKADATYIKQALCEQIQETKQEEEQKSPNIQADLDEDDMIAAMLTKKSKKGKKAAKEAPKKTVQAKSEPEVVEINKEERNKKDRAQLLKFIQTMLDTKARHVRACLEIIRYSNQCQNFNYFDMTFQYLTKPILKLLYLPATRFDCYYFIQNLLNENQSSPFFQIKVHLLSGLLAIAENKLTNKSTSEIQQCLMVLEESADFTQMGPGCLQVCLTISNYVLKDAQVNLSVKETGLRLAQSILDNNTEVQMIDLVRLTVNMLKTNYISNNLGLFLRKLIKRTEKIETALLLQPLFEYQPVPRKVLMTELLNYDEPLFCPTWFSTQMWMLMFDEDLALLARKISNKFGITLRNEVIDFKLEKESRNLFVYLRHQNHGIFQTAVRAASAGTCMLGPSRTSLIIDDLIAFYNSEWDVIKQISIEQISDDFRKDQKVQIGLIGDQRLNRIAVPQIFKTIAPMLQPTNMYAILNFLVTQASLDQNQEVAQASSEALTQIIKHQGRESANNILQILEQLIESKETGAQVQAIVSIGQLACYLSETSQKKLVNTFDKLLDLLTKSNNEKVCKAVCKCIPNIAKYFLERAKNLVKDHLVKILSSKDEKVVKSSAYTLVGLLKALGMATVAELDILNQIKQECFDSKKVEPIRKQAGLFFYDTLSFSMGKSFEVYLNKVFPHILASISDQKEPVRQAALSAMKTIMGCFSNYAIKQALPQFLKELQNDNWRSKYSTVEALGNMAFCAPKQISNFLPQIVKSLREILNDTHEKVHEAAIEAIKKIGSVIKCPEIGDMLETIVNALANTNKYLNSALKLLLETSFAHAIDAPSLSLLVPILDAGLTMHDNQSKQMAAQLMGNICSLTQEPKDLIPYMPILIPAIKASLFDAIPEIRASSAKALGRMSKGLGIDFSFEILNWLKEHLDKASTQSSEKSGAAQGFSEMISSHGIPYFESHIQQVIQNTSSSHAHIREAYYGVLVFLPGCFDRYLDYLPMLVPIMIQGLADDVDEVRKISMRNVKICIKQFARHSPNQLVIPVLRMMFDKDFRVRESSSILMFQLVKELENDIIKATPKYIDQETKHRILAAMFILKFDPIEKVNTQAGQIWKSIVDNQLLVLRQIIDTLIRAVFQIIQSDSYELQEMGLSCIRGMAEKMGEKLVIQSIEIFEELLNNSSEATKSVGVCMVMFNMASAASFKLLQTISPKIIQIIDNYTSHENEELREQSSKVFTLLFQRQPDKQFIDPILDRSVLYKLKELIQNGNEAEAGRLIQTLKSILNQAPELKIEDRMLVRCEVNDKKGNFTIAQSRVIKALAPVIAPKVYKKRFYFQVLTHLQEELKSPEIDDLVRIQNVLMAYAELLSNLTVEDAVPAQEEIQNFFQTCQELVRPSFWLEFVAHFCTNSKLEIEKHASDYLDNTFKFMNHPDETLVTKVIHAFEAVMERLSKETQMNFIPLIRKQIEINGIQYISSMHSYAKLEGSDLQHLYKKKVPVLNFLKQIKGVQSLVNYTQAAIMHGTVNVRTDAAFIFKYILDFTPADVIKKEIIKICGALIRVVNDKFPQDLKMQIFLALKLIQKKNADSAKAMQAQLQTTFLKALGDNQSTIPLQRVVIENTILLVKSLLRVDPILKELCSLIETQKIEGKQKEQVSECLALIIRAKGKSIQPAMAEALANSLTNLLQVPNDLNEIVLSNCAVALGYLSAFASDPKQMTNLFNSNYDNVVVDVACKFGILTNESNIDKTGMRDQLCKILTSWLNKCSGFVEINDAVEEQDKFLGAVDAIAHLLNSFGRRDWCQSASSPQLAAIFRCISESQVLKQLSKKTQIQTQSFIVLTSLLARIPVKTTNGIFSIELAEVIKDGFACLQPFYLYHSDLNQACTDAVLNLLQLNFDQFLDIGNDDSKVRALNSQYIKEASMTKAYEGLISEDMRLYSSDIILKKK